MENPLHQIREPSVWIPALFFGSTLAVLYSYYRNYYNYWSSRGLEGRRPFFVLGDLYELFSADRLKCSIEAPRQYGKLYGSFSFGKPHLVVADPEVIRQICIKDFDAFVNRDVPLFINKYQRRFLFWTFDDDWKSQRTFLSPIFTSGKIKRMYKLLDGCAEDLVDDFKEQYISARRAGQQTVEVNLSETFSMYTLDGMTTCFLSLRLTREKASISVGQGSPRKSLLDNVEQIYKINFLRLLPIMFVPEFILKAINYTMQSESSWQGLVRRLEHFILQRRKGFQASNDDLLSMMLEARSDDTVELGGMDQAENHHASLTEESLKRDQEKLKAGIKCAGSRCKLTDIDIVASSMVFLWAGSETTTSTLSSCAYYLAYYQDVQERLFQEIKKIARYEKTATGKRLVFEYDDLTSCQYLDAVVSESLRMVPPALSTSRVVSRDYLIEKYNYRVPEGTLVVLNIAGVHHDPDYWHEPEKFNPDRFMPAEREKIVPSSYLPFAMGPRHCIGMRSALTEIKLGLAKVLMNFKLEPAQGTKYPPAAARSYFSLYINDCRVRVSPRASN